MTYQVNFPFFDWMIITIISAVIQEIEKDSFEKRKVKMLQFRHIPYIVFFIVLLLCEKTTTLVLGYLWFYRPQRLVLLRAFAELFFIVSRWKVFTNDQIKLIEDTNKAVLIFSHTDYTDFYLFTQYFLKYTRFRKKVITLVKPDPFEYADDVLRFFGAIPATKVVERNGGKFKNIIDEIEKRNKCLYMICPKGTIMKAEWRTSWYYTAKELGLPIIVGGLDYERNAPILKLAVTAQEIQTLPMEQVERKCKDILGEIVPLYPDREAYGVNIRNHSVVQMFSKQGKFVMLSSALTVLFFLLFY